MPGSHLLDLDWCPWANSLIWIDALGPTLERGLMPVGQFLNLDWCPGAKSSNWIPGVCLLILIFCCMSSSDTHVRWMLWPPPIAGMPSVHHCWQRGLVESSSSGVYFYDVTQQQHGGCLSAILSQVKNVILFSFWALKTELIVTSSQNDAYKRVNIANCCTR